MGAIRSVNGGMRLSRAALVLALLALGTGAAWADRLGRSACKELKIDLADLLARSAPRDDMKRGPEWAKANLTLVELKNIKRLIELEEQLEFRCKMRRSRILAVAPAYRKLPPEIPERKPSTLSEAAKPALATVKKQAPAKTAKSAAAKTRQAAASGAPASKRHSPRRKSSSYVSPREVNPLSLTPLVSSR